MRQTVPCTLFNLLAEVPAAALPPPQQLHAAIDLAILLTICGFLLLLAGFGCLELARRKKRKPAIRFCCLLPVIAGVILASVPTLTAWYSRREQKTTGREYLAYTANMDEAAVEEAYHAAAAYNLALSENRTAVGHDRLPEVCSVIAVLELPTIGQTLPVYLGTEADALQHGAGLLPESSLPIGGTGTHAVILGCAESLQAELFTDLDALRAGDRFYIRILGRTLTYRIDWVQSVAAADISFSITPGADQVTLVTAYTDDAYFLVHGVNVNTP